MLERLKDKCTFYQISEGITFRPVFASIIIIFCDKNSVLSLIITYINAKKLFFLQEKKRKWLLLKKIR